MTVTVRNEEISSINESHNTRGSLIRKFALYGTIAGLPDGAITPDVRNSLSKDRLREIDDAIEFATRITSIDELAEVIVESCVRSDGSEAVSLSELDGAVDTILYRLVDEDGRSDFLTQEFMGARRELVLSVVKKLSLIRCDETDPLKPKTTKAIHTLNSTYLAGHPSMIDYLGGPEADIEVAARLSRIPEMGSVYARKIHSIVYDLALVDDMEPVIESVLLERSVRSQLETLRVLHHVVTVMEDESYAEDSMYDLSNSLIQVIDRIDSWLSQRMVLSIVNHVNNGADDDLIQDAERVLDYDEGGTEGLIFTGDYAKFTPTLLAPSVVGARSGYGLIEGASVRVDGRELEAVDIFTMFRDQGVEIDEEAVALFQELHTPSIQGYVELNLGGIHLDRLSLPAQFRLLRYLGDRDIEGFDRICRLSDSLYPDEKKQYALLEAFLATEFGDDFADSILTITERTSGDQLSRVFDTISGYRKLAPDFAKWFGGFDPQLQKAIQDAMNERLTEAMSLVEAAVVDGEVTIDTLTDDVNPNPSNRGGFKVHFGSLDEVLEGMEIHHLSLQLAHDILSDPEKIVTKTISDGNDFQIYRFSSPNHGEALLHVRRKGSMSYDSALEYGSRSGTEATVSLVVNPIHPFHLSVDKDREGVSVFRLDREGRRVDESPHSDERLAIRKEGLISYDASSILGASDSPAVKAGRVFAAGNTIRSQRRGLAPSLHHNTNFFDQDMYGTDEGFARIVDFAIANAEAIISNQRKESRKARSRRLAAVASGSTGQRPAA